ncbi:antitoxin [Candidatus Roizmanbacteria bacterium CG_4_8_14_3_um_filter_34_9]|uniref:Antitoxin n=3 Tax=Candidatus Roizmaniibacteriota TaxID=1752723 RepID=A0A2M7AU27_9BACT|nr:MAG: antitoxin [Candidatus Roizmanbacteria bacterium CG07_land_8_20_14_0_80_34_15]PIU74141.1 MAG: antitoxin [Candidatus Roizmanbacteria bacterium CG06_land_8_20_14_3_00_34_14]PIW73319.1 MAG: antitoxin [Candidatus Roizmanbacteria bacterium CG_4_8_14_3_um_filter_34_9]
MNYQKYITINPKILAGKPVITGTRIPVDIIIKKLGQNMNVEEILQDYPRVTKKAILASLRYAGEIISKEEIYPLTP